jgi:hypothetical protein
MAPLTCASHVESWDYAVNEKPAPRNISLEWGEESSISVGVSVRHFDSLNNIIGECRGQGRTIHLDRPCGPRLIVSLYFLTSYDSLSHP